MNSKSPVFRRTLKILSLQVVPLALLSAAAVSCKSQGYSQNPYEDSPYYGPQGGQSTDYVDVSPVPSDPYSGGGGYQGGSSSGYQAPPPAAPSAPPAPPSYTGGTASGSTHTVVKGDTLYSLSRRYGTTVDAIKAANGLTSDLIRIGQTLTIPSR